MARTMKPQLKHRLEYWLTLPALLALMIVVSLPTGTSADITSEQRKQPLYVLVTGPYPDPDENVWDGGISLIPAVRLAFHQINQHPDILQNYTLELIEADSGCSWKLLPKVFHSFTKARYYDVPKNAGLVGIIGPACSDPTLAIAPLLARPEVNMLQIAATATSPKIEMSRYNTTITMISSFLVFIDCMVDLMKCNKWFQVGILINELETPAQYRSIPSAFTEKLSRLSKYNISNIKIVPNDEGLFNFLQNMKSKIRIHLVIGGRNTMQKIVCLAHHFNMTYPQYQWIFTEKSMNGLNANIIFMNEGRQYTCSEDIMARAANGSIFINYKLTPDGDSEIAETGLNYAAYREMYNQSFYQHWEEPQVQAIIKRVVQETNRTETDFMPSGLPWENAYYDAGWTLGLALNQLAKQGYNLNTLIDRQPGFTQLLIEKLLDISFIGATGPVHFHKQTTSADIRLTITQVLVNHTSDELTEVYLASYEHRNLTCPTQYGFISHEFQQFVEQIDSEVSTIVILITSIQATIMGLLQTAYILWRQNKSIKAASPNITHFSFLGCYFLALALVFYTAQRLFLTPSNIDTLYSMMCQVVMWCLMLGSSLILSTLFVKTWRLYKIFRHFGNKSPGPILSDTALICFVILFLLADIAICTGWTLISPWTLDETIRFDYSTVSLFILPNCTCQGIEYWIACVAVYKGGIAIMLVTVSVLNRKIQRKNFSHTKKVNALVYSLIILGGIGFPLYFLLRDKFSIYLSYLTMCTFFLLSLFLCTHLLLLPPIIPVLRSKLGNKLFRK